MSRSTRIIGATCLTFFLLGGTALAQNISRPLQIGVFTGYEQYNLNWSIAGNISGKNPDIYSELKWKEVSGQSVSAAVQYTFWKKFTGMVSYSRMFIRSGRVTDNDYNADNRTNQVYGEIFNSNKGNVDQFNVGLGYELINNTKFSLMPFIGYETSRQSLSILDLTGEYPELNSNYLPVWKGVFVKCRAQLKLNRIFKVVADISYSQSHYEANADWNVIQTFKHPVSYRHTANCFGVNTNAALSCNVKKNIAINIGGGYLTATTGTGTDELFLASGGSEKTQLNGVSNNGYRLFAGVVFNY